MRYKYLNNEGDTEMTNEAATAKFNDIKAALLRDAKAVVGLHTFDGEKAVAAFEKKYGNDLDYLYFSQTRIYEKNVRYVVRSRIGAN
jgi:hypothetical protein